MSPAGSALSEGSSGDYISHFASIRVRAVGVGNLMMIVHAMDNARSKQLVPFILQSANRILPTRIVNFMEQRATFELKTTGIDERFRVNRIIIFSKTVFTSHPGN